MQINIFGNLTSIDPVPVQPTISGGETRAWQIKKWMIIATLIVSAAFLAVTAEVVLTMRSRALEDKMLQLRNIALVLAEQIDRNFQSTELVQQAVATEIEWLYVTDDGDFARQLSTQTMRKSLKSRMVGLPHISGLTIRNTRGDLINSSFDWTAAVRLSPNPADYFLAHPGETIMVGQPTLNENTGRVSFYLSRRIAYPNGLFAGFVNGTTDLTYYLNYFKSITLGEHSAIALFRDDGTMMVRYPHDEALVGKQLSIVKDNVLSKPALETRQNSPIDGQDKIVASHKLPHYPVHVVVTSTVKESLSLWRETTFSIILASAVVLMFVALFATMGVQRFSSVLNTQSAQFTSAVNNMSRGLVIMDENRKLVLSNDSYARMYGLPQKLIQPGTPLKEIIEFRIANGTLKADPNVFLEDLIKQMNGARDDYISEALSGRLIHVSNEPILGGGYLSSHEDVTEIRQREESFKLMFENNPIPMWVYDDATLSFVAVNDAAVNSYGYTREEFLSLNAVDIRPEDERERFLHRAANAPKTDSASGIWKHRRKDGSVFEARTYAHALNYEGYRARLVAAIDVTEQREAERRIAYIAHHDKLTDLPNRSAFDEHVAAAIAEAKQQGTRLAVMCLDLDGFKQVNDFKGHSAGDVVLREIAARLREASGDAYLARFGGDEFTLVCPDNSDASQSHAIAQRLIAAVDEDLLVEGQRMSVGLSIGIALFPSHGDDAKTLLVNADLALYRAKRQKRGTAQYFNSGMDAMVRQRRAMQEELGKAVAANELSLHFQPQVSVDRAVVGYEALVRWNSAKFGNVPPGVFIPLAEESDLISEIGDWILREACREAASWPGTETIAVNISPRQFQQVDLTQLVSTVLLETGLKPSRLELEITEGVLVEDFSRALFVLRRIKNMGIDISLDDFGTGYSSLSYLHSFPFDRIKIDRTFITDLEQNRHSRAIVRAVIGLGQSLGIPILAEGVENETQFAFLRSEGCQFIQGYLIGYPVPATELPWNEALKEAAVVAG
jgi:diguanylate cyclase (GGDEF)-like protein/PAS domain S-box-containing protein